MNAQKESLEFDLNILYRLERTKRPGASIAVHAELLAAMTIQGSSIIDCQVRFLSETLKMGTHTVLETLQDLRRMGLISFIPIKGKGNKRLIELGNKDETEDQFQGKCNVTYFRQAQAMVEAGTASNLTEAAWKIAEDTGETKGAVRVRIQRGKDKILQPVKPRADRSAQQKFHRPRHY